MVTPSGSGPVGAPAADALGASENGHYDVSFALGQVCVNGIGARVERLA